jgi:hypothetical protein
VLGAGRDLPRRNHHWRRPQRPRLQLLSREARASRSCSSKRRTRVGGAAVTDEFLPGFRNSAASYTVSLLNPKVIRDLDLVRHGLKVVLRKHRQLSCPARTAITSLAAAAA